ncbi:unnamed protein product, partial [Rotaria sp. Silwood1]
MEGTNQQTLNNADEKNQSTEPANEPKPIAPSASMPASAPKIRSQTKPCCGASDS